MATKKVSPKKVSVLDADQIISAYMEDVLNHEKKPATVYGFCKAHGFEETSFYQFFGNIEALEKGDDAITLFVLLIAPIKKFLGQIKIGFAFPETITGYGYVNASVASFSPLSIFTHAGIFLILSSFIL